MTSSHVTLQLATALLFSLRWPPEISHEKMKNKTEIRPGWISFIESILKFGLTDKKMGCFTSSYAFFLIGQINWNQRPQNLKKLRRKSSSEDHEVNGSWHLANQSFLFLFNYDVFSVFGLSLNLIGVEHSSLIKACFLLTGWCTNYLSAHR